MLNPMQEQTLAFIEDPTKVQIDPVIMNLIKGSYFLIIWHCT